MARYIVARGDTLYKIARKVSGTSGSTVAAYVSALVSLNNIVDANKIYPGQVINYPDAWVTPVTEGPPAPIGWKQNQRQTGIIPRPLAQPVRSGTMRPSIIPGNVMTVLKNPMVLGAIAIALLAILSRKG